MNMKVFYPETEGWRTPAHWPHLSSGLGHLAGKGFRPLPSPFLGSFHPVLLDSFKLKISKKSPFNNN